MRAKLASIVLALLVLTGTMVVSVPAAHAGCYDWSCDGKDPQTYGCSSDARTIDQFSDGPRYFELRFSSACWAAWTRVKSPSGSNLFAHTLGWDGSGHLVDDYRAQDTGYNWTAMAKFSLWVQSCEGYYEFGNIIPGECTAQH